MLRVGLQDSTRPYLSLYPIFVTACRDRLVRAEMYKVVSMVKPPSALFGPAMAWSAAKEAAREAWALATGLVTRA